MHEQGSRQRAEPLRAHHPGLFHGHSHGPGAIHTPDGKQGAHGGIVGAFQKFGDFVGGLLGFGKPGQGGGTDTPPPGHSPPTAGGGGGAGGSSKPSPTPPPGPTPPSGKGSGADDSHDNGSGAATPTTPDAARPSTTGHSTSSTLIVPASSPPIHSVTLVGSPYPSLSALSAPPAQSPTPGAGTPSTGNNQTSSSSSGTKKAFPLAAAGVLGAVLSFLVVSTTIWGFWFHLRARKRRRANAPEWDFETSTALAHSASKREVESFFTAASSARSTTTIPYFISAHEAGHLDATKPPSDASSDAEHDVIPNPFARSEDEREVDPFDSPAGTVTLRRGNT